MKKFRLQSVLDYRKNLETQIQQEFLYMQENLSGEIRKLLSIQSQLTELQQKIHEKQTEDIYPAAIELHYQFLLYLSTQEKSQKVIIEELEENLEKKRQELWHARQERKMMEKLKEKAMNAWQKELLSTEQKTLDEKAMTRYHFGEER